MARPASNLHLQPKNGGWRARVLVPVELQAKLGKKLFHTPVWRVTKSEAAALAWPEVQKFEALIENARSGKCCNAVEVEVRGIPDHLAFPSIRGIGSTGTGACGATHRVFNMLIYGDFLTFDIKLSRAELARHEAGHAITAAVLGWSIEWVGINEAGGSGEVEPKTGPFVRLDEPLRVGAEMVVAMAGSAAKAINVAPEIMRKRVAFHRTISRLC